MGITHTPRGSSTSISSGGGGGEGGGAVVCQCEQLGRAPTEEEREACVAAGFADALSPDVRYTQLVNT
jgi:hypothetical protein